MPCQKIVQHNPLVIVYPIVTGINMERKRMSIVTVPLEKDVNRDSTTREGRSPLGKDRHSKSGQVVIFNKSIDIKM